MTSNLPSMTTETNEPMLREPEYGWLEPLRHPTNGPITFADYLRDLCDANEAADGCTDRKDPAVVRAQMAFDACLRLYADKSSDPSYSTQAGESLIAETVAEALDVDTLDIFHDLLNNFADPGPNGSDPARQHLVNFLRAVVKEAVAKAKAPVSTPVVEEEMPESVYVVKYANQHKKVLRLPVTHPEYDDLWAELKRGRWRNIVVETWRRGGDAYALFGTMKLTPLKMNRTAKLARSEPPPSGRQG